MDLDEDILDDTEFDQIVEQEMKTSQGKDDQRKLKDIVQMTKQTIEVKSNPKKEDKFSNSKAAEAKEPADEEDIDEFIKKHLEDDKENEKNLQQQL